MRQFSETVNIGVFFQRQEESVSALSEASIEAL